MKLIPIPKEFIDYAWFKDSASCLSEACDASGGEITGDQLKMLLSQGQRVLLKLERDGKTDGWGVVRVDQLPNLRVLHACELVAHNGGFEDYYKELKKLGALYGCSRLRWSSKDAQGRLFTRKLGGEKVYSTYEVKL